MRKMKTAMDVQIRQTKTPSFQNIDQAIRQTAFRRMSSAGVLREEVLSELPDQYRRVLNSMSPREQEKLLSKVEVSVNRKIASGAFSKMAARLDERDQEEIQRIASGGSRDTRRRIIADKYRLPEMKPRAGPNDILMSVPTDSLQLKRYIERAGCKAAAEQSAMQTAAMKMASANTAAFAANAISNASQTTEGHHGFMRTISDSSFGVNHGLSNSPDSLEGQLNRMKALQGEYIQQHSSERVRDQTWRREPFIKSASDTGDIKPQPYDEEDLARERKDFGSYSEGRYSVGSETSSYAGLGKQSETTGAAQAATGISEKAAKELAKNAAKKGTAKAEAIRTRHRKVKTETALENNAERIESSGATGVDAEAALSQYQQLLNPTESSKGRKQLQKAMQKAIEGTAGKKERAVLRKASQKAAFDSRETSDAYRKMLMESGLQTDGQKAAVQMAYEKQIRKRIKTEYRKELIGKLSKQKTQSLMKKAEEKKYQKEQAEASESNRAMTDQVRSAAGVMSAGAKALRRITEDAAKAIKTLVQKKLILFIIPVILVAAIPVVMVALPLISAVTATSSEDNEVYAYADAAELISYAQQWIGKIPYVWGGGHGGSATAWQSGCACSGYVHGVFNHFGYEIGGDTGAMETQAGTHIAYDSLANAKPGDVLIYYRTAAHVKGDPNGSGSTHVSIYEGNNRIIHQAGGVHESTEYHQYFEVRRVLTADVAGRGNIYGGLGGMGTYGHRTDNTNYSTSDLQLIWAIVAQEDNGSYKGALAVISTAMNRVESPQWSYEGSNALAQLTAPGQFCYSNDHYWEARLGGNVPDYVKQAVNDCLKKGKRNHSHTSFRSTKGKTTGADAVQIGGNWYFG